MSWGDLNDHYASKLTFYLAFALKRLIYAFILDLHHEDGCTAVKYLVMINAAVILFLKSLVFSLPIDVKAFQTCFLLQLCSELGILDNCGLPGLLRLLSPEFTQRHSGRLW